MSALVDVHAEFSRRLSNFGTVVLAGGSVRDTLLSKQPKDFDVFILQGDAFNLDDSKPLIIATLHDLSEVAPKVEWHRSEPFLAADVMWRGHEVQVMCSPSKSLTELVGSFDWSVCLFGFDGDYLVGEPLKNIGVGKELRLQTVTYPLSTLRRGFRFSERFSMKLKNSDIKQLCKTIADVPKKKETP